MKAAVPAESFNYLSTFIVICLLQRCLQTIVRLVLLSVLHFNIFSNYGQFNITLASNNTETFITTNFKCKRIDKKNLDFMVLVLVVKTNKVYFGHTKRNLDTLMKSLLEISKHMKQINQLLQFMSGKSTIGQKKQTY